MYTALLRIAANLFWGGIPIVLLAVARSHPVFLGIATALLLASFATHINNKAIKMFLVIAMLCLLIAYIWACFLLINESNSLTIMLCALALAELFAMQVKLVWPVLPEQHHMSQ